MEDQEGEDGQSWHVHTYENPYCMTWTIYAKNDPTGEKAYSAALSTAQATQGVVLGPFDFDYLRCQHRLAMEEANDTSTDPVRSIAETLAQELAGIEPPTLRSGCSSTEGRISYHIHMDEHPYCSSHSTDYLGISPEEARELAETNLKNHRQKNPQLGAMIFGPVDFSDAECAYRAKKMEERRKSKARTEDIDEWKSNTTKVRPGYTNQYHVHTDGRRGVEWTESQSWCQSYGSKKQAEEARGSKAKEGYINVRVIGPVDYPAIDCHYYQERERRVAAAKE